MQRKKVGILTEMEPAVNLTSSFSAAIRRMKLKYFKKQRRINEEKIQKSMKSMNTLNRERIRSSSRRVNPK